MKHTYFSLKVKSLATVLLISILLIFNQQAKAAYNVSSCGGGMLISTGNFAVSGDDVISGSISMPFAFTFYGTSYSSVYVSSNGFISFNGGGSACCSGYSLPFSSSTAYIALAHTDLYSYSSTPGTNGSIYYNTVGTAPNRVFVVQYQGVDQCCGSSPIVTGEIQLYEGTNEIRIVSNSISLSGRTVTMGIAQGDNVNALVVSGRNAVGFSSGAECWSLTDGPPPCATPSSLIASPAVICGSPVTVDLTATSSGNNILWYTVPSGGTALGTAVSSGATFTTPSTVDTTTLFYAEAVGGSCTTSPRASIEVIYNTAPSAPTSVTASPSTICFGLSSNLNATSAGNNILWFTTPSGGTSIGASASGADFTVSPSSTTTYYAEAQTIGPATTVNYNYTGSVQSFTVPTGVTSVTIDAYGAQGGSGGIGALGGRIQSTHTVVPGQVLNIYVGGQGILNAGGYNGGGGVAPGTSGAFGGGGASDVRIGGTALSNRVIVAGGGGGTGAPGCCSGPAGGIGGGTTGGDGLDCWSDTRGFGGSQTAGGNGSNTISFCGGSGLNGTAGSLGQGGTGGTTSCCTPSSNNGGGGGGGGYYGGGGSSFGGAGGGSSYSSGSILTNIQGVRSGNGLVTITYNLPGCSSTTRTPVSVVFGSSPASPISVSASPTSISCGGISNLTATSSGNNIAWYTTLTGGTPIGIVASGTNLAVSPTSFTTYYAETQTPSGCLSTTRTAVTVNVSIAAPTSATASPSNVTCYGTSNLNAISSGYYVAWYTVPTGGTPIDIVASGVNLPVNPTATTIYYAETQSSLPLYTNTYNYTGSVQTFTVPSGVTSLNIDASGAQGGNGNNGTGGLGGRVQSTLSVTPGQVLNIYVGSAGGNFTGAAGYNGGGIGANSSLTGGGGGATDIRIGGTTLTDRVLVAGGGGGGGWNGCGENGGAGGGITGGNAGIGCGMSAPQGGSSTAGGAAGTYSGWTAGTNGTLGIGGNGASGTGGAGGGGGYYGGGGGTWQGGAGGSSYSSGSSTTHTQGYKSGNGQLIITYTVIGCISSTRTPVTVTVTTPAPTSTSVTPPIICVGGSANISAISTGNNIDWYDVPSGGTSIGTVASGASLAVSPTTTTIYYAETQVLGTPVVSTYSYTGAVQTFTVPTGVTSLSIDASGAQGGNGNNGTGGLGGRVQSTIPVTPGQVLNIYVGGAGGNFTGTAGYNGGGIGASSSLTGGGGGATDIRIGGTALTDRVLVAGGGGGGGWNGCGENGGAGGGTLGGNAAIGCGISAPQGGSASAGGAAGTYSGWTSGTAGTLGIGGNGGSGTGGAGGGGGYYGGGGGTWQGGAGGSSYSIGSSTTHTQGSRSGNGQLIITYTPIGCTSSTRTPVTVTIGIPAEPTSVTASPSTICAGASSNLNAVAPGASIAWFTVPSGGTSIGSSASGADFAVSPTLTTTYYAETQTSGPSATVIYNYTGSLQTFTVPSGVTSITIDARGAQGGGSSGGTAGGRGARMTGTYSVTPGQVLNIVVGGMGQLQIGGNPQNSSGGGGGSFVYASGPTLLVAAGGGGGKCNFTFSSPLHSGADGQITTSGGASSDGNSGGTAGNGGNTGGWPGGGGAGWLTSGVGPYGGVSYSSFAGGPGYCLGGGGGCGGAGGYGGGGGGGNAYGGGGGGGGYSGGGGGTDPTHGGGGGSYSIGSAQSNTAGYQLNDGQVIISYSSVGCSSSSRTPVTINIGPLSPPISATASPSTVSCPGESTNVSAISPGNNIDWYTVPSGGTSIGITASGANLTVNPTSTTTYYAESQLLGTPVTNTYTYTGAVQTFTVPAGVGSLTIDAVGAKGGNGNNGSGGNGGRVQTTLVVTAGQVLNIYVGGAGGNFTGTGGYNGGGNGANTSLTGGGGGATDIRIGGTSLTDRVVVAGGGGGGGWNGCGENGGAGGGTTGGNAAIGCGISAPQGGTSTAGGAAGVYSGWTPGTAGSLGIGGNGGVGSGGAGGGGGYYGGGSGTWQGGAGGSSYSSGTSTTHTQGYNSSGDGQLTISYLPVSCVSPTRTPVTVTVTNTAPAAPTPVTASPPGLCSAGSTNLNAISAGNNINWYTVASGGTAIGTSASGADFAVSLTTTTIYYAEAVSPLGCVSITRTPITISIGLPPAPILDTTSITTVCSGSPTTISAISPGNDINWYSVATGGSILATTASGASYTVSPTSVTTYYASALTPLGCESATRLPITVTTNTTPPAPTSPTINICSPASVTLTASGLSSNFNWYTVPTGGTAIATGATYVTPTIPSTTNFYVEEENIIVGGSYVSAIAATGSSAIECNTWTGDDRGGIVVTSDYVYVNGDMATGRFNKDLSGAVNTGVLRDHLFSDLAGTGTVYTFSTAGGIPGSGGTTIDRIQALDANLNPTGSPIMLSTTVTETNPSGIYSGVGFVILHTSSNVYRISLPSGTVTTMPFFSQPSHAGTENWAWWGWAEKNGADYYTVFTGNFDNTIKKMNMTTGVVTTAATFSSLSDMANIIYSPWENRWYFHHEGGSQFRSGDETVGYADATIVNTSAGSCIGPRTMVTVNVGSPTAPTSGIASPSSICSGASSNISAVSSGNSIAWYTTPTGGTPFATVLSGATTSVNPTVTTTYYAEAIVAGPVTSLTYNYTGSVQTFTVPSGITSLNIDASGAQGYGGSTPGALGGRVTAVLPVTPGQVLNIYVGGAGTSCNTGGYNGGAPSSCSYFQSGNGGGATDIRIGGTALSNRVIVAGGGGGAGLNCGSGDFGGVGGGLTGGTGMQCSTTIPGGGNGGTSSAGGIGGTYSGWGSGSNGVLGQGGVGGSDNGGGGGGGGYYGGGGGAWAGGGGGSSYTDPTATSVLHTQGYRAGDGILTISYAGVGCVSATRTPVDVNVGPLPAPTAVTATPTEICASATSQLTATSAGNIIKWYTVPTGGTEIGISNSGENFSVSPTTTTIYYAEAVNGAIGGSATFNYTGAVQTFTVPTGVTSLTVDASGAQGYGGSTPGGLGGRVQAVLPVTPGQVLNIYVGGAGLSCNTGGYNGGAAASCSYTQSGTGGGATDIRIGGTALSNRVLVAGGGGGAGLNCGSGDFGGVGGGLTGGTGMQCSTTTPGGGNGGTASAGGAGGVYPGWSSGNNGTLGLGGAGGIGNGGGGGGGGYYGGGGGAWGGGGGGSSYTDPTASSVTHTQGYRSGNGTISLTWPTVINCVSPIRTPVTVTIGINPPTSVSATPTSFCSGGSAEITATTSTGNTINWYTAPTGGTLFANTASGDTITVTPTITTTYYAETQAPSVTGSTTSLSYTGSLQTYTVPAGATSLTITTRGAQGGNQTNRSATGGLGAIITGTYAVTPGQVLNILVGGQGSTATYVGGGGGGTFVWDNATSTLLQAAGGGGGAGEDQSSGSVGINGVDAVTTTNGSHGFGMSSGAGIGGNGGVVPSGYDPYASGGAGWFSNGSNGTVHGCSQNSVGGTTPLGGGAGGTGGGDISFSAANGGYGGGGGGNARCGAIGGGGGGGYSGGGGGGESSYNSNFRSGGGGGSFNSGSSQTNTVGNTGNGSATITVAAIPGCVSTTRTPVTVNVGGSSNVYLTPVDIPSAINRCDEGPWSYYEDPSNLGKYIFAINWGTLNNASRDVAVVSLNVNPSPISSEVTRSTGNVDASYLMKRYWNVDIGSTTLVAPVSIKFFYDPAEIAAITATRDSELTVLNTLSPGTYFPVSFAWFKTVGMPFTPSLINDGNNFAFSNIRLTPSATGTETGVNYVQFDGITSFSGGTGGVGISPSAGVGLPVTFTNIEAVPVDNKFIQVRWTTATEINNKGFDVMRSEDGINFTKVGYVAGHNNSTTSIDYTFNDYDVISNVVYYYRLIQIDNDGATTPTRIVNAVLTGENGILVGDFYPNPTRNITSIDINNTKYENISIKVYDMMGNLVMNQDSKLLKGLNKISLNMNMFADGNYYASILLDNQEKFNKKIIIQK